MDEKKLKAEIERAAKGGTNRTYTEGLRKQAAEKGIDVPEDRGSFKRFKPDASTNPPKSSPHSGQHPTSPSTSNTRPSWREERKLRQLMKDGDQAAFDELSRWGRTNNADKRAFQNARKKLEGDGTNTVSGPNQPSSSSRNSPQRKDEPQPVQDMTGVLRKQYDQLPVSAQDAIIKRAKATEDDLVKKGFSPEVARGVVEQYLSENLAARADKEARRAIQKQQNDPGTRHHHIPAITLTDVDMSVTRCRPLVTPGAGRGPRSR